MRLMKAPIAKGYGEPLLPERPPEQAAFTCSDPYTSAILLGNCTSAEYFGHTGCVN